MLHVQRLLVCCLAIAFVTQAKTKTPGACKVYFTAVENDEITVGLTMVGLNKPQASWYKKHGDRDKFSGICFVKSVSDAPASVPLYAVVWGEHLASRPYTYHYQTNEQVSGTVTDSNGDTSTVQTNVPVEHTESGESRFYVADGWLATWDRTANAANGAYTPIAPLHNHNTTKFTSASTSLLKDAMEQIAQREKGQLTSVK